MAEVKYIELEGNPTFTNKKTVANIEKNFLRVAKKNPGLTWVLREQGFGKEGQNQWAKARKDVYVLGATKTKDEYYKRKALGKKKGGLPKYDPQKAVPRTSAAATLYHTGKRYNQELIRQLSAKNSGPMRSGYNYFTDAQKKAEWQKKSIKFRIERIQSSDIKYFQDQGAGKKAFALAAEQRDKRIKKLTGAGVRITQSGDFEGRNQREARLMFEGLQEARAATKLSPLEKIARYGIAEDGQPKLVPSNIKITDEFIDEVNARSFGTVKQERAFKAGALEFLKNKEAFQQIKSPESVIFTPQRLEDTRSWHSGSNIGSFKSAIPNYVIPDLNKVDTKFVGNTLITGLTRSGPETGETTVMGDPSSGSDYGRDIDEEVFNTRSSFVNMLPDQATKDFNYNIESDKVPIQITSSAEELQASEEPTIRQTVVNRTKGGTWDWENSQQATTWKDYPGRIYHSEQVDTGKTAADLKLTASDPVQYAPRSHRNYFSLAPYPHDVSSLISSSMSRTVDKGTPEHDAVQDYLKGSAATDGDVADSGGIKPTIKREVAPGLEDTFNEGTDMINIEQEATKGWKGKISLTSAYPHSGSTSSNTSQVYEKGHKRVGGEKGYSPTPDEKARAKRIDAMTPMQKKNALIEFGTFLNQKESEYNARVAAGTQESFIQDLRDKKAGITSDGLEPTLRGPEFYDSPDTWEDIGPARSPLPTSFDDAFPQMGADELLMDDQLEEIKQREIAKKIKQSEEAFGPRGKPVVYQPKPAVVPAPKPAVTSGKPPNLTEYDLSQRLYHDGVPEDFHKPVNVSRKEIVKKTTTSTKPQADIELKKSAVLSKESGKPTFTTKGEKVKTAAKTGAKLLKGPGSTTLNALSSFTLLSPAIGAFGAVVKEQKREEEAQAAYPLHPPKQKTLWSRFANMKSSDYTQALMHRLAPEEIYGKEGYPSLKKVKDWKKRTKGYGT